MTDSYLSLFFFLSMISEFWRYASRRSLQLKPGCLVEKSWVERASSCEYPDDANHLTSPRRRDKKLREMPRGYDDAKARPNVLPCTRDCARRAG